MDGFKEHTKTVASGASVYCQYRPSSNPEASARPLLLLIHGYPQNHKMWIDFVNGLPDDFSILIPDLPGCAHLSSFQDCIPTNPAHISYGQSTKPPSADGSSRAHSKKAWSQDLIEAARQIHTPPNQGELKLIAFGHDRGARLAYRMALDAPGTVVGLAVLDIVPTPFMWARMSLAEGRHDETRKSHHWVSSLSSLVNHKPLSR
jgi:haloacetate dehalogenase